MKLEDIKISCLVCTLRAPPSIDALLDSLLAQDWLEGDELLLIDNGMSDPRRAQIDRLLEAFTARGISAQRLPEPRPGVVHARLQSIRAAKNPWLFSLDDDNILGPGALRQIRRRLFDQPDLGGICPRIEPVWEVPPAPWVVALGHQVLSYNASAQFQPPVPWQIWPPGVVGQRPPTGGMIIARTVAEDFVRLCEKTPLILSFTPRDGRRFTGEDFILYSLIYRRGDLSTAYDAAILVQHQIPQNRMTFSSLLKTLFWSNYSFGIQGLMRFGKAAFPYVLARGTGRLLYELFRPRGRVLSWRIAIGCVAGCLGFGYGVAAGLFDPQCRRIDIDP